MRNNNFFTNFKPKSAPSIDYLINLESSAGNVITDLAGNSFTNNGVTTVEDPVGSGNYVMNFEKTLFNYINFGLIPEINLTGTESFFISLWAKYVNSGAVSPFISRSVTGSSSSGLTFAVYQYYYTENIHSPSVTLRDYGFNPQPGLTITTNSPYINGTWVHYAVTYNAESTILNYYKNSVNINLNRYIYGLLPWGEYLFNLKIGNMTNSYFQGELAKIKIGMGNASQSTVEDIFNTEKTLFGL